MNYKKNYIGKGTKVENLEIVKISLKLSNILPLVHTYKGEQYITFEVAKLQKPDDFGHDYTVYVNKLEKAEEPTQETPAPAPIKAKKSRKPKQTLTEFSKEMHNIDSQVRREMEEADLPF